VCVGERLSECVYVWETDIRTYRYTDSQTDTLIQTHRQRDRQNTFTQPASQTERECVCMFVHEERERDCERRHTDTVGVQRKSGETTFVKQVVSGQEFALLVHIHKDCDVMDVQSGHITQV
jgi:hypothetical protein